jgi:hypothetical protein
MVVNEGKSHVVLFTSIRTLEVTGDVLDSQLKALG